MLEDKLLRVGRDECMKYLLHQIHWKKNKMNCSQKVALEAENITDDDVTDDVYISVTVNDG